MTATQIVAGATSRRDEIEAPEFRARVQRLRAEAAARGLDGVVVWSKGGGRSDHYANVSISPTTTRCFLTSLTRRRTRVGHSNIAAVVPVEGELILVSDVPADEELVVADRIEVAADVPGAVGGAIRSAGLAGRRVGFAGANAITLERWRLLEAAAPGLDWVIVDDLLGRLRAVKSEAEVTVIRAAVGIGDAVLGAMLNAVVPGTTEADLAAVGYETAIRLGANLLDLPAASDRTPSTSRAEPPPHGPPARSHPGTSTTATCTAPTTATSSTSRARPSSERSRRAPARADRGRVAAVDAGIAALRPGATFGDAYRAAAAELDKTGLQVSFPSFGHGLGLGIESPWLTQGNHATVEPNMHIAVEALVTLPGVGMAVHEENVLITPNGPEVLSTVPAHPWA